MNINNFTFRSSIFLHLENTFEILEILGIIKVAENSYPSSPHSKSGGFCPQTFPAKGPAIFEPRSNFLTMGPTAFCIAQTFRSWGQPFCSNFAKIPHVGWVRRIKVPTSSCATPPPLKHDIDGCIKYTLGPWGAYSIRKRVWWVCGWRVEVLGPHSHPFFHKNPASSTFSQSFIFLLTK